MYPSEPRKHSEKLIAQTKDLVQAIALHKTTVTMKICSDLKTVAINVANKVLADKAEKTKTKFFETKEPLPSTCNEIYDCVVDALFSDVLLQGKYSSTETSALIDEKQEMTLCDAIKKYDIQRIDKIIAKLRECLFTLNTLSKISSFFFMRDRVMVLPEFLARTMDEGENGIYNVVFYLTRHLVEADSKLLNIPLTNTLSSFLTEIGNDKHQILRRLHIEGENTRDVTILNYLIQGIIKYPVKSEEGEKFKELIKIVLKNNLNFLEDNIDSLCSAMREDRFDVIVYYLQLMDRHSRHFTPEQCFNLHKNCDTYPAEKARLLRETLTRFGVKLPTTDELESARSPHVILGKFSASKTETAQLEGSEHKTSAKHRASKS